MFFPVTGGQIYYELGGKLKSLALNRPIVFVLRGGHGFDHVIYKTTWRQ